MAHALPTRYAIFHLPRESHEALFRTIHTFLAPGGYILVTMGSAEWEGSEPDFHGVTMWWSHYDPAENRSLIRRAGFEILLDEIDENGGERHQVILARARRRSPDPHEEARGMRPGAGQRDTGPRSTPGEGVTRPATPAAASPGTRSCPPGHPP